MTETVKTRILMISDTHCAALNSQSEDDETDALPFTMPLPAADLLIHCGDLTHNGALEQYNQTLDMLRNIDAPVKLVIAGNHDMSLDRDFVLSHLGRLGAMGNWRRIKTKDEAESIVKQTRGLWTASDVRAMTEGVRFLDEGVHQIDLPNGARVNVYASPYTPEFCDYGFAYKQNEDRFNAPGFGLSDAKNIASRPMPSFSSSQAPIHICVTHGPPFGRLDEAGKGNNVGCPHLLRAVMRARPLLHCFGHIHEGWGAEHITWSSNVDGITATATSTAEWRQIATTGQQVESVHVDLNAAKERHGVFLDVSGNSPNGIRRGEESVLVNAAVMDVGYHPVNAPWIVDLDLPIAP